MSSNSFLRDSWAKLMGSTPYILAVYFLLPVPLFLSLVWLQRSGLSSTRALAICALLVPPFYIAFYAIFRVAKAFLKFLVRSYLKSLLEVMDDGALSAARQSRIVQFSAHSAVVSFVLSLISIISSATSVILLRASSKADTIVSAVLVLEVSFVALILGGIITLVRRTAKLPRPLRDCEKSVAIYADRALHEVAPEKCSGMAKAAVAGPHAAGVKFEASD